MHGFGAAATPAAGAQAANERNAWGFARVGEEGLAEANAHVEVAVAQVTTAIAKL